MADPYDTDSTSSFGADAARAKDDLNARFQDLRRDAVSGTKAASGGASTRYGQSDPVGTVRSQASQAADDAKGTAATLAEQARLRLNEIVGQQKSAGADKIAGVAKAAHSAAEDLDKTNPHMARLVRIAADNVDRVAEDVRSRDIGQVFATLADFGRRQPVAFFGGAVLGGFLLSRLLKIDAPIVDGASLYRGGQV